MGTQKKIGCVHSLIVMSRIFVSFLLLNSPIDLVGSGHRAVCVWFLLCLQGVEGFKNARKGTTFAAQSAGLAAAKVQGIVIV